MKIEYDNAKNLNNIKKHNFSFENVKYFDFDNSIEVVQSVNGEERYFAMSYINNSLYALVYTMRGNVVRVISLRKATKQEIKNYEQF